MVNFRLFHPDTEVVGQMVIDFEQAINSKNFLPILKEYGLDNVNADDWYSGQAWLDVLSAVANSKENFLSLVSIGMKQIDNVEFPPEFDDMIVEDVFRELNPVYQSYYRGTDVGEIKIEKVNDNHLKVILRVFEPDNIWYGNVYQLVKRFNKTGKSFTVSFDDQLTRRDKGGDQTIIHVKFRD